MSKKEIDRLEDLITELMCASGSLTLVRHMVDDRFDSVSVNAIDSIYATEHHIRRIVEEMDTIAWRLKKEMENEEIGN